MDLKIQQTPKSKLQFDFLHKMYTTDVHMVWWLIWLMWIPIPATHIMHHTLHSFSVPSRAGFYKVTVIVLMYYIIIFMHEYSYAMWLFQRMVGQAGTSTGTIPTPALATTPRMRTSQYNPLSSYGAIT